MTSNSTELWVFDMDRTLVDTDRTFEAFVATYADSGGFTEEQSLLEVKLATEKSGGSFDVLSYLGSIGVSSAKIKAVSNEFSAKESDDSLLYPDSRPLLNALDKKGIGSLILTFGSEDWQLLKLRATGLIKRPYIVTSDRYKGSMINSWRTSEGFEVRDSVGELIIAKTINLVDDKASSFIGLPSDCRGYLISRANEERIPSQLGFRQHNVTIYKDLDSLLPIINS